MWLMTLSESGIYPAPIGCFGLLKTIAFPLALNTAFRSCSAFRDRRVQFFQNTLSPLPPHLSSMEQLHAINYLVKKEMSLYASLATTARSDNRSPGCQGSEKRQEKLGTSWLPHQVNDHVELNCAVGCLLEELDSHCLHLSASLKDCWHLLWRGSTLQSLCVCTFKPEFSTLMENINI